MAWEAMKLITAPLFPAEKKSHNSQRIGNLCSSTLKNLVMILWFFNPKIFVYKMKEKKYSPNFMEYIPSVVEEEQVWICF